MIKPVDAWVKTMNGLKGLKYWHNIKENAGHKKVKGGIKHHV